MNRMFVLVLAIKSFLRQTLSSAFGLRFFLIGLIAVTFLTTNSVQADWCSDRGLNCQSATMLAGVLAPNDRHAPAISIPQFHADFETYLQTSCRAQRQRGLTSAFCIGSSLTGALDSIELMPPLYPSLQFPRSGLRLVADCQGARLFVALPLVHNPRGRLALQRAIESISREYSARIRLRYREARRLALRSLNAQPGHVADIISAVQFDFDVSGTSVVERVAYFPVDSQSAIQWGLHAETAVPSQMISRQCFTPTSGRPTQNRPHVATSAPVAATTSGTVTSITLGDYTAAMRTLQVALSEQLVNCLEEDDLAHPTSPFCSEARANFERSASQRHDLLRDVSISSRIHMERQLLANNRSPTERVRHSAELFNLEREQAGRTPETPFTVAEARESANNQAWCVSNPCPCMTSLTYEIIRYSLRGAAQRAFESAMVSSLTGGRSSSITPETQRFAMRRCLGTSE